MDRVKFDRDGERGRDALGMGNCSISIWGQSELELAWSKISSSYFENNFPIFLSSGISNTSFYKMCDVSQTSPIFSVAPPVGAVNIWIYFISHLFFIIANKFFVH